MFWEFESHVLKVSLDVAFRTLKDHSTCTEQEQVIQRLEYFLPWLVDDGDDGNAQPRKFL